jgi:sec-independent protein translocase protein TatB
MFDIAWSELLLIAVLALIFIGPKELPQVLNSLGKMAAKLRRSADDFRRQFEDSIREAGYGDLNKNLQEFQKLNPASQLRESIDRALNTEYAPSGPVLHSEANPDEISPYSNIPLPTPATPVDGTEGQNDAAAPQASPQEALTANGVQTPNVTPEVAASQTLSADMQKAASPVAQDKSEHAVPAA